MKRNWSKSLWAKGLCLALGGWSLYAWEARAEELEWMMSTPRPSAVSISQPVPLSSDTAASLGQPAPLVRFKADEAPQPLPVPKSQNTPGIVTEIITTPAPMRPAPVMVQPGGQPVMQQQIIQQPMMQKPMMQHQIIQQPGYGQNGYGQQQIIRTYPVSQAQPAPMNGQKIEPIPAQPRPVPQSGQTYIEPEMVDGGYQGQILGQPQPQMVMSPGGGYYVQGSPMGGSCACDGGSFTTGSTLLGDCCSSCVINSCDTCSTCDVCAPAGCGNGCFDRGRFWLGAEYLLLAYKGQNVPPLVSTGNPGLPINLAGALGQPDTQVLYGGERMANNPISGGRVYGGFWFTPCGAWGMDASLFGSAKQTTNAIFASNGDPVLARPIQIFPGGQEQVEPVAFPGVFSGSIGVSSTIQFFGADINLRRKLVCSDRHYLDLIVGFKHFELEEGIEINENLRVNFNNGNNVPDPAFPVGIVIRDTFQTRNTFNGGQIGFDYERRFGSRFYFGANVKVALGNVHQRLSISGNQTYTNLGAAVPPGTTLLPGVPVSYPFGVLASRTNIGSFERDRFAVMPEVGLKLGMHLTEKLRLFVGYDFMYISSVIRPGESIDRALDITQTPGAPGFIIGNPAPPLAGQTRPAVIFRNTDFWAQGFRAGLEYQW